MGDIIYLNRWRAQRPRLMGAAWPEFYFDLGSPLCYLTAERVEQTLGAVRWMPVSAAAVRGPSATPEPSAVRERAEARARALNLPLVWPEPFPVDARCALRAAVHAAEAGVGASFALSASRLAFCGGFDLADPETVAEAAAASGIPLEDCLRSARDVTRDDALEATARRLRTSGIRELPAFHLDGQWFQGESGLLAAAYMLHGMAGSDRPAAPVL